ncbi:MAG TPA: hypothetical protein VJZ49_01460 [Syntrophales bacterium]|nr:hypothetical protein [Syntrophales bacterium]
MKVKIRRRAIRIDVIFKGVFIPVVNLESNIMPSAAGRLRFGPCMTAAFDSAPAGLNDLEAGQAGNRG